MRIARTFADARDAMGVPTALVPTMGYVHEGHLSLVEAARAGGGTVVVSLFVNPLQFDSGDDLAAYPRDIERDAALLESAGADVLFAPSLDEMYPDAPATRVTVDALTRGMEGVYRPGHFEGVATVVTKLLGGLQPHRAHFGRKDAQQLAVVQRLVSDLSLPVEIVPGPTVRESDGLALSSRNVRLGGHRTRAAALAAGLFAAADAVEEGERDAAVLETLVTDSCAKADLRVDYVELADAGDVIRLLWLKSRAAFLAAAVWAGDVRLIDNVWLVPDNGGFRAERGRLLKQPSLLYER